MFSTRTFLILRDTLIKEALMKGQFSMIRILFDGGHIRPKTYEKLAKIWAIINCGPHNILLYEHQLRQHFQHFALDVESILYAEA